VDVISEESRKIFQKIFPVFKSTGHFTQWEIEFVRKDGSTFPGLVSSTAVLDKQGKFKVSRTIVFNITEQKLLDEQLQKKNEELNMANEKLSLANKEKDRFIGIASHDLQNPLVAINLLSTILLREEISDPDKLREIYGGILQASVQMNDLIKNYLNVNRIETGSVILNVIPIDITQLIHQIISRYVEIGLRKQITIYFSPTKNFILDTDRQCFSQIFENIISNAIKYTPRGKNIFVKIYSKGGFTNIQIEDEGVGIKKNELPLLYNKFQKLSSKPTDGEPSTGLGLNIVKFLVDQLKGMIKVKSTIGGGSIFTVSFRKDNFKQSSLL
jgi:signal transduction histidine kinase